MMLYLFDKKPDSDKKRSDTFFDESLKETQKNLDWPDTDQALRQLEVSRGCKLGLYLHHLETGATYSYHGQEAFPMASVCKLPVALHLLQLYKDERLRLDSMVTVHPQDYVPGSGQLQYSLPQGETRMPIRSLLALMLTESDNTATDLLLRLYGGPSAVTATLQRWGIKGVRVDRTVLQLFETCTGQAAPPYAQRTPALLDALFQSGLSDDRLEAAARHWITDTLDTATPLDFGRLWGKLEQGALLPDSLRALLYTSLGRISHGQQRIPAAVGAGAHVFHKTGTFFGTCNDVALVRLPGSGGRLILIVFMKGPNYDRTSLEATVAQAARIALEAFGRHYPTAP